MSYKNPKELLTAATALPAAIEAKLPAGAPKISTMLLDATGKMPVMPDFPFALPNLPAIPELPGLPETSALRRTYVSSVEVRPVVTETPVSRTPVTPLVQAYSQPIEGVVGTVSSRRGM